MGNGKAEMKLQKIRLFLEELERQIRACRSTLLMEKMEAEEVKFCQK